MDCRCQRSESGALAAVVVQRQAGAQASASIVACLLLFAAMAEVRPMRNRVRHPELLGQYQQQREQDVQ